jgi:O-antigen/teichoic acid export membrane protein
MSALFPVLAKLHQDSKQSFRDACAQASRYLLYLAVPLAFCVTLWARPIVSLFFGPAYDPSVVALQILIWAAAIMYVTQVLGNAFLAANLQKLNMKLMGFQAALNIGLNVFLIPAYSYFGASIATVAAVACVLPLDLFFLARNGFALGFRGASLPPFFALAVIVAISALLHVNNVPLALITIVDLCVYAAVIYKFGVNEKDKQLMLSLLRRSRSAEAEI